MGMSLLLVLGSVCVLASMLVNDCDMSVASLIVNDCDECVDCEEKKNAKNPVIDRDLGDI